MEQDLILTVSDVAKLLKVSTRKVYQMCKDGEIRYSQIGGSKRFLRKNVLQLMEQANGKIFTD